MSFAGINYLAVLLAAIAAFAIGSAYYGIVAKPWMRAAGIDPKNVKMSAGLFATSFIAELIMAWVLAGIIGHLGPGQVTWWNGIVSGAFVWLGFMATTVIVNQRYEGFGWDLSLIDSGHWLLVAIVMGAVIGAMGV